MKLSRIVFACLLLLSGCASVGPGGCAETNWYRMGYTDGWHTWYSLIDEHISRCAVVGVKPDAARYQEGWADGRFDFDHKSSSPN